MVEPPTGAGTPHPTVKRFHQSLKYQLRGLLKHNRDGSYATQRRREQVLIKFFADLKADGYKLRKIQNLKPKHILNRIEAWRDAGKSPGTIKTELSHLRWLCEKLGKADMLAGDNAALGIAPRELSGEDKSFDDARGAELLRQVQSRSEDLYLQMRLMRDFGLRFEEAALLRPHENLRDDVLHVVHGTKGGRVRVVPIATLQQRALLDQARRHAGPGRSLIPQELSFRQWRNRADHIARALGLSKIELANFHALRHAYAQDRYLALTGQAAPCRWTDDQRAAASEAMIARDRWAREIIAGELGHGRTDVTTNYLGHPLR